jgi:hypothetical protein
MAFRKPFKSHLRFAYPGSKLKLLAHFFTILNMVKDEAKHCVKKYCLDVENLQKFNNLRLI